MPRSDESYLRTMSLGRKLAYFERTWGVRVEVCVILTGMGEHREQGYITVSIPNFVHQSELYNPPAYSIAFERLDNERIEPLVNEAVVHWLMGVEDHLDTKAR